MFFGGRKGNSEVREEIALTTMGTSLLSGSVWTLGYTICCALPASSNPENSQGSGGENMCNCCPKHGDELNET